MSKQSLIAEITSYKTGFLKSASSIQRRIRDLADIEHAAQEAREALEATLDDLDESREPVAYGYYTGGKPRVSGSQDEADKQSTCTITPLYDEQDKAAFLAGAR